MAHLAKRWLLATLAGLLVAVGLVIGGLAWRERSTLPAPVEPSSAAAPPPQYASHPAAAAPMPPPRGVPAEALGVGNTQSLRAHVANLLATHNPHDTYTAYWLIQSCNLVSPRNAHRDVQTYDNGRRAFRSMTANEKQTLSTTCSGLTERERLARLDYLEIAIKAGVHGAAWAFAAEGPFGDPSALTTRPDDPLVREWKAKVKAQLTEAAEGGDMGMLILWGVQSLHGSEFTDAHPVRGYSYLLAFGLIQADHAGPNDPSAQAYRDGGDLMNAMAGHLTPQQRAAGLAEARRIAASVKAKRQRESGKSGVGLPSVHVQVHSPAQPVTQPSRQG